MVSTCFSAAVATCIGAALLAAPVPAASSAVSAPPAAASAAAAPAAAHQPDSGGIARPAVLVLATVAAISFVTRRLRT